jgi:hypothetical protein
MERQGSCGKALIEKTVIFWDREDAQGPQDEMTDAQRDVTRLLRSTLSVPIFRPTDTQRRAPVGILNLDSRRPIGRTHFGDNSLQLAATDVANTIGAIL